MTDETRATPVFVLIPAYQPSGQLPEIVRRLAESSGVCGVVVVDDGSSKESRPVFDAIGRIDKAHVLRHFTNLGKGAALKTGMNYGACAFGDAVGAVTADADGQHRVEDVLAVAEELRAHPDHLVLGVRTFQGEVPFKNRVGNVVTRLLMKRVVGQRISDTQTGLRGIPIRLIPRLLRLISMRYEFELDMLLICKHEHIPITETRIETIYIDGNVSSHFNPVLDSMRISFVLLRFLTVSLISSILDNIVFALVFGSWPVILGSQVAGRIGGAVFNYVANKRVVFHSDAPNVHAAPKYVLLVVFSGSVSYGLILLLVSTFGMKVVLAKFLAETLLFTFNFIIQRDFIFTRRGLLVSA